MKDSASGLPDQPGRCFREDLLTAGSKAVKGSLVTQTNQAGDPAQAVPTLAQEQLAFVISAPRSGSTLLQRMLGAHSSIFTHPEPHLITPMAHLGYYATVDKAPYDHINAAEALRSLIADLPHGEDDYYDALRAYSSHLYGAMLSRSGDRQIFLDKTPAYALVLPFLTRLYPKSRYIVLTRHPLAIFSSYANSFFHGDWQAAYDFNPIVERYVAAIGRLLRERPLPFVHVGYEALVASPEEHLARIFEHIGLEHQASAVVYGKGPEAKKGMGDPIGVAQHDRPVVSSVEKWAGELVSDPAKRALAERMIEGCSDADLEAWGFDREAIWAPVLGAQPKAPKRVLNRYTLQRRILLWMKKDIEHSLRGRLIRRVKYYCDVILRD